MENIKDYICSLTREACDRGRIPECPKSIAKIVSWCKWYVNKKEFEIKEKNND